MRREHAILYVKRSNTWAVIAKDDTEDYWFILAESLDESSARMMLRGAEA